MRTHCGWCSKWLHLREPCYWWGKYILIIKWNGPLNLNLVCFPGWPSCGSHQQTGWHCSLRSTLVLIYQKSLTKYFSKIKVSITFLCKPDSSNLRSGTALTGTLLIMSHSLTMSTFVPSPLIAKYSHSPCLPMILDFLTKIVSFIKEWNIAGVHFNLHLTQVYTSLGAGPRGLQWTRHCGFCRFSTADVDRTDFNFCNNNKILCLSFTDHFIFAKCFRSLSK